MPNHSLPAETEKDPITVLHAARPPGARRRGPWIIPASERRSPAPDDRTMTIETLSQPLQEAGFAFVEAAQMAPALREHGFADWETFAHSWNDLGLDRYMADGGRYRRRRHAAFAVSAAGIERKPHQPHYQSRDYNPLNGGLERWFEPISNDIGRHPALLSVLRLAHVLFDRLTPEPTRPAAWHVEVHQFRVEARTGEPGQPTPEGMHRDGVDWVLVLLVDRHNVASGTTTILDLAREPVGNFVLAQPLDTALVDDGRVFHGVTPIEPVRAGQDAHRDVLVVTFRR
jgi:hypothetical protein